MPKLRAFFFDIGGTLGDVDPATLKLKPYATTRDLLKGVHALGVQLGVISNTPAGVGRARILTLLKEAHLDRFFEPAALITSADAGVSKPNREIFELAAKALKLEPNECVYFGENPVEVAGALAAQMQGIQKP
jgi:HAD superfamily hydrolase (TIGR01509 family)